MKRLSKVELFNLRRGLVALCAKGRASEAREMLATVEDKLRDATRHDLNDIVTSAERNEDQRVVWSAIRTLREKYTGDLPQGVSSLEEALARLGQ